MDLFSSILSRRSIRKYSDKKLPEVLLGDLLKCAMYALSAMNSQAWQFVVIYQREKLDEIIKAIPQEMLKSAKAAILVYHDVNLEKNIDYIRQNCSAAT